jgi:uncharacterized protein (TIGR03000 family)
MFRRIASLALLVLAPATGSAQFLERWEYWGKGYGYGQSGFDIGRGYRPPPSFSYVAAAPCSIRVYVPATAQVFFDNAPTSQTGAERLFVTPPLDMSQPYSYTITARWTQNGQDIRHTHTVRLVPGQTVNVDFTAALPIPRTQAPPR